MHVWDYKCPPARTQLNQLFTVIKKNIFIAYIGSEPLWPEGDSAICSQATYFSETKLIGE